MRGEEVGNRMKICQTIKGVANTGSLPPASASLRSLVGTTAATAVRGVS